VNSEIKESLTRESERRIGTHPDRLAVFCGFAARSDSARGRRHQRDKGQPHECRRCVCQGLSQGDLLDGEGRDRFRDGKSNTGDRA
jgi:hypothetical protein